MTAAYLSSFHDEKLQKASRELNALLSSCALCPRLCKVNRLKGEQGFCKTKEKARVYRVAAHHGEEPCLSGTRGSGTIFFSGCNMACVYCQNFKFSQNPEGKEVTTEELARHMLELQRLKCHNINLVTPTHILPQILEALLIAIPLGLTLPIVYNTSGYELPSVIALLRGIVDIYLADMRYADEAMGIKYSRAPKYPFYNQEAILEMHAQAGIPLFDTHGIITKGLIIRHLVLPNKISGTQAIMRFIAERVSPDTYISLMSQYLPCHNATQFTELSRRICREEYRQAQRVMEEYGLHHGWTQEGYGLESLAGIHMKQS